MRIDVVDKDDAKQMAELRQFAESFEHDIQPTPWPMYVVHNDEGKRLGYFQVCQPTLIYPAIHPHCTPREVYEAGKLVLGRLRLKTGQIGALTPEKTNFTARIMEKLGFTFTNLLLYVAKPK